MFIMDPETVRYLSWALICGSLSMVVPFLFRINKTERSSLQELLLGILELIAFICIILLVCLFFSMYMTDTPTTFDVMEIVFATT